MINFWWKMVCRPLNYFMDQECSSWFCFRDLIKSLGTITSKTFFLGFIAVINYTKQQFERSGNNNLSLLSAHMSWIRHFEINFGQFYYLGPYGPSSWIHIGMTFARTPLIKIINTIVDILILKHYVGAIIIEKYIEYSL